MLRLGAIFLIVSLCSVLVVNSISISPNFVQNSSWNDTGLMDGINQDQTFEINYRQVRTLADGTEEIIGYRSTLDKDVSSYFQPDQTYNHPLSNDRIALLGGEELVISQWQEAPAFEDRGDLWFGTVSNKSASGSSFNETLGSAGQSHNLATYDDYTLPMDLTIGDVDGNFQEDIIGAYTCSGGCGDEIQIRIWETWQDNTNLLLASNNGNPFGGEQKTPSDYYQPLQVIAANVDEDSASEFLVAGFDNGVETIYVFDDLLQSQESSIIEYGQEVSIKTSHSVNDYIYWAGTDLFVGELNGYTNATVPYRFIVEHPNATSTDENLSLDNKLVLKTAEGLYLSVNSETGDVFLKEITGNFSSTEIFTLTQNHAKYGVDGDFYSNSFGSFRSDVGGLLRADTSSISVAPETPGDLEFTFKISNASSLPYNFQGASPKLLAKLTNPHYSSILQSYSNEDARYFGPSSVKVGNFDDDLLDEFVYMGINSTGTVHMWIHDDATTGFQILKEVSWPYNDRNPGVEVGDVDGDGRDEILVAITNEISGSVYLYDDSSTNFAPLKILAQDHPSFATNVPRLYTVDLDNNGMAEIFFNSNNFELKLFGDNSSDYVMTHDFTPYPVNFRDFGQISNPTIIFADIDQDSYDEMVSSFVVSGSRASFTVHEWNNNQQNFTLTDYYLGPENSGTTMVHMAFGDINGDQFTVEFLNEIDEYQTPGEISVIAAAPPNQVGISQNYPATGTTFGESSSSGSGEGNEVASSYGYFLQAEVGVDIGVLSVGGGASRSITEEFSKTKTTVKTRTDSFEYSGGNLDDFVLYTSTIYDTYKYKILDAVNPRLEGRNLTINIPREPRLYQQTKEFYNENNNPVDLDVDSNIFSHTPGHVPSYSSKAAISNQSNSILYSQELTVGQGGGSQSVSIELSEEKTTEFQSSTTTEWEGSASVTVLGIGGGGGGTWTDTETEIHSVSVGESTIFTASVGSISDEQEYDDLQYAYGMAIYLKEVTKLGMTSGFYIINFWVDLPPNWGGQSLASAEEAQQVASGVNQLVEELPLDMLTIMSAIIIIPLILRRNNR